MLHKPLDTVNCSFVVILQNLQVWLGGLFISEAYITATRQYVAQANSWSLEELYLDVRSLNTFLPLSVCHILMIKMGDERFFVSSCLVLFSSDISKTLLSVLLWLYLSVTRTNL